MEVKDIPDAWKYMLHKIQEVFPQAIIAGGCLRDLQNGKPIKDVDIFINDDLSNGSISDTKTELQILMPELITVCTNEYSNQGVSLMMRNVQGVFRYDVDGNHYEIIVGSTEACDINHFDFGICQIKYDNKELVFTDAYEQDTKNKVIRVLNDHGHERTVKRIARMQAKYPDFTVVQ
jgi:tRNA nucleotidyltransferase/poly(A) polymerase